ncbi:hypothetical protein [Candidatus Clostridium stratigraminis]|uniref:Uncharacterized protein n=1 Tax=Candidatus Clostridium stratigraminis TaxID=3381661 RepID=A0ABW8T775_9CLOT
MKNFEHVSFDEDINQNNNCFCEGQKKGENRFVIMVDESQECEAILTGHPFQEVFIDISQCKDNITEQEEDKDCKDVKKQKTISKRGSIK